MFSSSELILIRHAAADTGGRLCGRTDVGLLPGSEARMRAVAAVLRDIPQVWVSPARRCRETVGGIFQASDPVQDARLWEQDFGDWDGQPYDALPDLGQMDRQALAEFAAPSGESFADLVRRVAPALKDASKQAQTAGPLAIVAHAGIVRAGLSIALSDVSAGLTFEVDPLSLTRLRCLPDGDFSIQSVNWTVP